MKNTAFATVTGVTLAVAGAQAQQPERPVTPTEGQTIREVTPAAAQTTGKKPAFAQDQPSLWTRVKMNIPDFQTWDKPSGTTVAFGAAGVSLAGAAVVSYRKRIKAVAKQSKNQGLEEGKKAQLQIDVKKAKTAKGIISENRADRDKRRAAMSRTEIAAEEAALKNMNNGKKRPFDLATPNNLQGTMQQFNKTEWDSIIESARAHALQLVPSAERASYAWRDRTVNAGEQENIRNNQLHLKLLENPEAFAAFVKRHVSALLTDAKLQQAAGGKKAKAFYFSSEPVYKNILLEKLRKGEKTAGLAIVQEWLQRDGAPLTIDGLFHVQAQAVREQLLADPQTQSLVDLEGHPNLKVRAMASGIHTATYTALDRLAAKGTPVHEINTDDMCPDWAYNKDSYMGLVRDIYDRTQKKPDAYDNYYIAVLTTPTHIHKMNEQSPRQIRNSGLSKDALIKKASSFAKTLQEAVMPDKPNVLLLDTDFNVVLHRENGKDKKFDMEKYTDYLRSCAYAPPIPATDIKGWGMAPG